MSPLPGVTVTAQAVTGFGAAGGQLGTFFIAGQTELGALAPDPKRPVRSLADFVRQYGARVPYSPLYGAVDVPGRHHPCYGDAPTRGSRCP